MSDIIVAPETRDLDELAGCLSGWLASRLPDARHIRVDNLSYPRGAGQSHETVLFDAHWQEDGAARTQGCVVRIKPKGFTVYPDTLFDEQYQVMCTLFDMGRIPVARPLWMEPDPSILGNPFFVMEKKIGRVPVSIPPYAKTGWLFEATPEQCRHLWEGAVRQLAAIQLVPLDKVAFLAGPDHARDGLTQEWDKYVRFVAWLEETEPQPLLRKALERLEGLWPSNQPQGMVWGDARIGNMMFDDNFDVVAVMDWEQPSLGGALHDLAWFVTLAETMHGKTSQIGAPLAGMGSREETIALWQDICGKPVDDLVWYEDFTHLKMTCTGVRLGQLRGTRLFDDATVAKRLKVSI